jgi:hypothetical protein
MSKFRKLFSKSGSWRNICSARESCIFFLAHPAPSPLNDTQDLTLQLPHRSSQHPQTKRNRIYRIYRIEPKREIKYYYSIIMLISFFRFLCTTCDWQRFSEYQKPIPESRVENQSTGKDFKLPVATDCRILRLPSWSPTNRSHIGTGVGLQNYVYILRNVG